MMETNEVKKDMRVGDKLYRIDDFYDGASESNVYELRVFYVEKLTRCGAWIVCRGSTMRRFIRRDRLHGRQWAREAVIDALRDYVIRKQCEISHLNGRLMDAQRRREYALDDLRQRFILVRGNT